MLLIVGFLLGSAATPAFADYGYNRVTSGSFILRGMFTNGGKLLSSGSFNLYGALSLEQGASKLSSASFNLDFEFPSIIRVPRTASASATETLARTIMQALENTLAATTSMANSVRIDLTQTAASTETLLGKAMIDLTNALSRTLTLLSTNAQDIGIGSANAFEAFVNAIRQDITVTIAASENLSASLSHDFVSSISTTLALSANVQVAIEAFANSTLGLIANVQVAIETFPAAISSLVADAQIAIEIFPASVISLVANVQVALEVFAEGIITLVALADLHGIFTEMVSVIENLTPTIQQQLESFPNAILGLVADINLSINAPVIDMSWVSAMLFIFFLVALVALFAMHGQLRRRRNYS